MTTTIVPSLVPCCPSVALCTVFGQRGLACPVSSGAPLSPSTGGGGGRVKGPGPALPQGLYTGRRTVLYLPVLVRGQVLPVPWQPLRHGLGAFPVLVGHVEGHGGRPRRHGAGDLVEAAVVGQAVPEELREGAHGGRHVVHDVLRPAEERDGHVAVGVEEDAVGPGQQAVGELRRGPGRGLAAGLVDPQAAGGPAPARRPHPDTVACGGDARQLQGGVADADGGGAAEVGDLLGHGPNPDDGVGGVAGHIPEEGVHVVLHPVRGRLPEVGADIRQDRGRVPVRVGRGGEAGDCHVVLHRVVDLCAVLQKEAAALAHEPCVVLDIDLDEELGGGRGIAVRKGGVQWRQIAGNCGTIAENCGKLRTPTPPPSRGDDV